LSQNWAHISVVPVVGSPLSPAGPELPVDPEVLAVGVSPEECIEVSSALVPESPVSLPLSF
jgi:hypothetical protein